MKARASASPSSMRTHGTMRQRVMLSRLDTAPEQASLPILSATHSTGCHTVTGTHKLLQAANREAVGWTRSRRQQTCNVVSSEGSDRRRSGAMLAQGSEGSSGDRQSAGPRKRQGRPTSASAATTAPRVRLQGRVRTNPSARACVQEKTGATSYAARAARAARCLGTDSILALSASLDMRRRVRIEVQHIARQAASTSPKRTCAGKPCSAHVRASSARRPAASYTEAVSQTRTEARSKLSMNDPAAFCGGDGSSSNNADTFAAGGLWEQYLGNDTAAEDSEMARATEFMCLVFGVSDPQSLQTSSTADSPGSEEEGSVVYDNTNNSLSAAPGDESVISSLQLASAQLGAHARAGSSMRAGVSKLFRITGGTCPSPVHSITDPRRISATSGIPEVLPTASPSTSPTTSPSTSPDVTSRSLQRYHCPHLDVNQDQDLNQSWGQHNALKRNTGHHKNKGFTKAMTASRGFAASTFVGGRGLNLRHAATASVDDRVEKLLELMCERVELAPGTIFELFEQARRRQSSVLSGTGWRAAHSAAVPVRAPEQSENVGGAHMETTVGVDGVDGGSLQNFDSRMLLAAQRCAALRDQAIATLDALDRAEELREARLEERAQCWSRAQARQRARKRALLTAQAQAAMREQRGELAPPAALSSSRMSPVGDKADKDGNSTATEGTLIDVQSTAGNAIVSEFEDDTVDVRHMEHHDQVDAARLHARRAQLRRRIAALQRLGCHINKERADYTAHLRCQAVAASADAPARKLLLEPGNMGSLEAQWRLSGRLGIAPCAIAAEVHSAAIGASSSRSKVVAGLDKTGTVCAVRRLHAARAWRWALHAAIPLMAVRFQWKLEALRAKKRAEAHRLPRSPNTKVASTSGHTSAFETKAQYEARISSSMLMAGIGIPNSVAMRLHLKVAIMRKRKAAALLRNVLEEWEASGAAVRVRRRRVYMWKQLLRVSHLTRRLQALARGMHSCVNARVEVLLRMWIQYEDEHAQHKSQARRREARSGMAGRLDEETQLANARCFDFDRRIQELLGTGARTRAQAEAKERVAEELKRELLRHYVVLQRKYCMERKKIALDERTRPVSAADVQGFLRDTQGDSCAKLSQIAFTSMEELTRSAATASRTRMVLMCDARDRRSGPNRRNLRELSKWCTRKSNLALLHGATANERRALLQKAVLEVVNPACMCTYCAQHNESVYNAAREKDGDLRQATKGSWRSGSPASYIDTGASSISNQSFYSYGGSSTGLFSPGPSRSSTRTLMYK